MASTGQNFQKVGQYRLDRTYHVWKEEDRRKKTWKCVLCGGISSTPTDTEPPNSYEPLTDEERALCPRPPHKTHY